MPQVPASQSGTPWPVAGTHKNDADRPESGRHGHHLTCPPLEKKWRAASSPTVRHSAPQVRQQALPQCLGQLPLNFGGILGRGDRLEHQRRQVQFLQRLANQQSQKLLLVQIRKGSGRVRGRGRTTKGGGQVLFENAPGLLACPGFVTDGVSRTCSEILDRSRKMGAGPPT